MLTVEVVPAQWRKESNQYTVSRMGYIIVSFFELTEGDLRIDGATKKTFIVTLKNMDVLLDLDSSAPFNSEVQNEELMLYKNQNTPVVNIIRVAKNTDRTFTFTYCEMVEAEGDPAEGDPSGEQDIVSYNEITLKPGQVKMIQEVCRFGIAALTGMHAIYSPSLV